MNEENTNINVNENEENNTSSTSGTETEKTYTQDEVMLLLQREADKRVTEALKKQEKKHQKELSLSKLDDNARAQAEKDNKIAELEAQLAKFTIERNKSELKSVLASRGLSAEFADIVLINDDIEASQANIDKLDRLFKAAVKAEVEKRLAGHAPKVGKQINTELTEEGAKKLSIAELQELAVSNPELFNKIYNK